jgi:xanthine dehydrogenase accessory factor
VIIRGGGDLATGVAYRLHRVGLPVVVLELAEPLVVRRAVSLASAVHSGEIEIEGLIGRLARDYDHAVEMASTHIVPILVSPNLPDPLTPISEMKSSSSETTIFHSVIVDARMAKRNIDTTIEQADTVIALGPGFVAGDDCHAVIETMRGHRLGRVIWEGKAIPNTGTPGIIGGRGADRVLRAPTSGIIKWGREIGDLVHSGDVLGSIEDDEITAPFDGVLRGLIAPNSSVRAGLKIGDVDSRSDVSACFTISDKALSIGGGVLEAILTRMNEPKWRSD